MGSSTPVADLQKQFKDHLTSLFNEEILNDQFTQLQSLQDESNPNFVVEVVTLFFQDSQRLLNELAKSLEEENVNFKKLDSHVHQFKGSSSSIGAQRVQNACIAFRNCCHDNNIQGCLKYLHHVRSEYLEVKSKLETLFNLEQQIIAAGGSIPYALNGY